jgi:hypothetical protein
MDRRTHERFFVELVSEPVVVEVAPVVGCSAQFRLVREDHRLSGSPLLTTEILYIS